MLRLVFRRRFGIALCDYPRLSVGRFLHPAGSRLRSDRKYARVTDHGAGGDRGIFPVGPTQSSAALPAVCASARIRGMDDGHDIRLGRCPLGDGKMERRGQDVGVRCLYPAGDPIARPDRGVSASLAVWLRDQLLASRHKTLVAGGGYGRDLGIHSTECCFALSADSRLAVIALMLVPIALYLQKHTVLLPAKLPTRIMYLAVVVLALASAYGIYERTGVIVAAMLGLLMWLKSKRKVLAGAALVTAVVALFHFAPENWMERMTTMTEYNQESSARHRLDVWAWTYNYVVEHPLGGGFNIYEIDEIGVAPDGTKTGLAYHNDFFEVLGEQGWPGLLIFVALIMTSFVQLRIAARRAKRFRQ